ncbi:Myb-like DNA-binding domain [Teratosphaeria destructans]|uniref:Myb-like DNA-binding domain n=1 Tax=Teratosphaeria destructans TaxID=418781 RepID=A0A9W7W1P8_9PEZI|nr:Myb-like DNA-binding domain [Teratosphaeria destructans]
MPKELKPATTRYSSGPEPYPTMSTSGQRVAAIWSATDDEILLQARASGLNWQPIASRHFPNKTANACRKRHERLIERRHGEDWDAQKLEVLAQQYMACRKEMWEILASRVGERWTVVEAKCLEKGLKNIQSTSRTAQRRASAASHSHQSSFDDVYGGNPDHNSDSGIGLASDTEMEAGEPSTTTSLAAVLSAGHVKSASRPAHPDGQQINQPSDAKQSEHVRSKSLTQSLPLYQPPPPVSMSSRRVYGVSELSESPSTFGFGQHIPTSYSRCSPDTNARGGISIQSVLGPAASPAG